MLAHKKAISHATGVTHVSTLISVCLSHYSIHLTIEQAEKEGCALSLRQVRVQKCLRFLSCLSKCQEKTNHIVRRIVKNWGLASVRSEFRPTCGVSVSASISMSSGPCNAAEPMSSLQTKSKNIPIESHDEDEVGVCVSKDSDTQWGPSCQKDLATAVVVVTANALRRI